MTSVPQKPGDEKTFIYALVDPTDKSIRYIGKSDNPEARYLQHMADRTTNRYKTKWIANLRARGMKPALRIMEEIPVELWSMAENHWIDFGKLQGWPLTNIGPHGGGKLADNEIDEIMYNYLISDIEWNVFCSMELLKKQRIIMSIALDMFEESYIAVKAKGGNPQADFNPDAPYLRGRELARLLTLASDDDFEELCSRVSAKADELSDLIGIYMIEEYGSPYGYKQGNL